MKRKLLSIILSMALVITMLPAMSLTAFAATPEKPVDLSLSDSGVASWTITDDSQVKYVYVFLYNSATPSDAVTAVSGSAGMGPEDVSRYLIPGESYYFTVYYSTLSGEYSDTATSATYTIPGSYTRPEVPDLSFDSDGAVTWSTVKYATGYALTLYEKSGSEWNNIYSEIAGRSSTRSGLESHLEEGKTYKASLVAIQGNIQVSQESWTNEFTRNALTPIDAPTDLHIIAGVLDWNPVAGGPDSYQLELYDESDNYVTNASGSFRGEGIRFCDFSNRMTVGNKYYFKIKAYGDNINTSDSEVVQSALYEYKGGWSGLEWDGTKAKWNSFYDAEDYWVYLFKDGNNPYGQGFGSNGSTEIDLAEQMALKGDGSYTFSVVPKFNGKYRDELASYTSSETTYTAPVATLNAPDNLRWNGTVASWDPVADATGYAVNLYKNGGIVASNIDVGSDLNIDLILRMENAGAGVYTFEVRARKGAETSEWSSRSGATDYEEFEVPKNLAWDGMTATWDYVPGADQYWVRLYKNGYVIGSGMHIAGNRYDFIEEIKANGAGDYTFVIKSCMKFNGSNIYSRRETQSPVFEFDGKEVIDVSDVTWTCPYTRAYTGKSQEMRISYMPPFVNAIFSGNKATKVGTYTAKVSFEPQDPEGSRVLGSVADQTWKIVPKKASVKSLTSRTRSLTVKMSTKVSSTGGGTYKIAYRQKGTSKWKYTTTTSQSKTIKKLKKGKRYQIKVCAYKKIGTKTYTGAWSTIKTSKKIK